MRYLSTLLRTFTQNILARHAAERKKHIKSNQGGGAETRNSSRAAGTRYSYLDLLLFDHTPSSCMSIIMAHSTSICLAAATTLLLSLVLRADAAGSSSYNGLALTPAMGWDNWNAFGCKVSEDLILSTAQKIVEFGLRDLGKKRAACNAAK